MNRLVFCSIAGLGVVNVKSLGIWQNLSGFIYYVISEWFASLL